MRSLLVCLYRLGVLCAYVAVCWVEPLQQAPTGYETLYVVITHLHIAFLFLLIGLAIRLHAYMTKLNKDIDE